MRANETGSIALVDLAKEEVSFICHLSEMQVFKTNAREQGLDLDALESVPITTCLDADLRRVQVVHDAEQETTDVFIYAGACHGCARNTFKQINGPDVETGDMDLPAHTAHALRMGGHENIALTFCQVCRYSPDTFNRCVVEAINRAGY